MNIIFNYNINRVGIYSIFIKLILLNAFVSLTARLYPSWFPLGKLIGGLIIIILLVIYYKTLKRIDTLFLVFLFLFSILPIINSTNIGDTLEHVIDFFTSALILWKASSSDFRKKLLNETIKSKKLIKFYIQLSIIIIILSFFSKSSYSISSNEEVFIGFALSNHILCGTISFYIMLISVYLYDQDFKLKYLLYYCILILAILKAGARSYLILPVCYLIVLYFLKLRTYSLRYFIVPTGVIAVIYAFLNSSSYARFLNTSNNKYISSNSLEAMTSGRLIWWKIDIEQYMNFSFLEKLFGVGHSRVFEINEMYYGLHIWAHNDFVQILLALGIIGLIFYIFILTRFLFSTRKNDIVNGVKFPRLILLSSFIINAVFNGYYTNLRLVMATVFMSLLLFKYEELIQ